MKVYIDIEGDPSVGIDGETITVDWPSLDNNLIEPNEREVWRGVFYSFVEDNYGDMPISDVRFDDECPDCATPYPTDNDTGIANRCQEPDCPSNSHLIPNY